MRSLDRVALLGLFSRPHAFRPEPPRGESVGRFPKQPDSPKSPPSARRKENIFPPSPSPCTGPKGETRRDGNI